MTSIIERAFRALSFDPSDLEHKIFDLLSIRAKIEQIFFEHFRSRSWSIGWIFERSEPNFERSYAWSLLYQLMQISLILIEEQLLLTPQSSVASQTLRTKKTWLPLSADWLTFNNKSWKMLGFGSISIPFQPLITS